MNKKEDDNISSTNGHRNRRRVNFSWHYRCALSLCRPVSNLMTLVSPAGSAKLNAKHHFSHVITLSSTSRVRPFREIEKRSLLFGEARCQHTCTLSVSKPSKPRFGCAHLLASWHWLEDTTERFIVTSCPAFRRIGSFPSTAHSH